MRMNRLGNSDLVVSAVGAGTWAMGGDFFGAIDDKKCIDSLCASLDHGVNLIDTAPIYGKGHSETLVGQAIKGRRDKVVLCTKVGLLFDDPKGARASACSPTPSSTRSSSPCAAWARTTSTSTRSTGRTSTRPSRRRWRRCSASRRRARCATSASRTLTFRCWSARSAAAPSSARSRSIPSSTATGDVLPFCREHNIGVLSYGSLGAGILTGKFKEPPKPEAGDKRANFYPFFSEPFWSKTQELLKTLRAIAEEHDKPVTHVSINWVSQQKGMTCALTGSKNVDQAIMNAAAGDWDLSAEELARIDAAYDRIFRE